MVTVQGISGGGGSSYPRYSSVLGFSRLSIFLDILGVLGIPSILGILGF